ncbi:MAG: hypothetical protein ACPGQS_05375, partial [Bradymonadia bacterium]
FSNETPLTTAQSGLELRTADLENSADPTQWLRFVGRRLTPPVPELNDATPIQPWFVYRPENSPTWRWLILGILLPDGRLLELEKPESERLFIQRTGPWHTGMNESRRVVEAGTLESTLLSNEDRVCGKASVSAKFRLITPSQELIENVTVFAYTLLPTDRFHMDWLFGCGHDGEQ